MPAPYDPRAVANFFVQKSLNERRPIDHMKLQKLVYFSHGYYLAATQLERGTKVPLINEYFEAWPYGPVCPSVYQSFKSYGRSLITRPVLEFDASWGATVLIPAPDGDVLFDSVTSYVWSQFAEKNSMHLSDLTHLRDGAWDKARKEAHGLRGKDISNEYIFEDFKGLVKKTDG